MNGTNRKALLLMSVLLVSMFAASISISAENTTLTVSQERSTARVFPGDFTNVSFTISNPTESASIVFLEILDDEVPSGISINTEFLESTQVILNASSSTDFIMNITATSIAPSGSFIVGLSVEDNKGFSDTFEVVTTVEATFEFQLYGVSDPLEGNVNAGSWREYSVGIFNSGNIDDIYALSISDQQEIVDSRFLNTTGNWTVLTHSTSGVNDISDNIDAVNVSYGAIRYFYVNVQPSITIEEDTQFIFNLTISSVGSIEEAKLQIITTVVDNEYDVSLLLLDEPGAEIEVGGFVDYNFTVTGSSNVSENITLNVLGNLWAVQNGWEYLLLDENDSVIGGYYEPRAWSVVYEDLEDRNNAWKMSEDVTSAGSLSTIDTGVEWGFTDESETDAFGRYQLDTPGREWIYDPGIYEHPYIFELPENTTLQFTLRIIAPDNPDNAPRGTQVLTQVVAQVNEDSADRTGFETIGDTDFEGIPAETTNLFLYIGIIVVIVVVAIVLVAVYLNTKKNYYYPGEGEKCGSGYKKQSGKCVKK